MDLESALEGARPVRLGVGTPVAGGDRAFDPVRLGLGSAGEDGDHLVYAKYRRRVQRHFERKGFSPEDAADLTQETFLRVFRTRGDFGTREQFEAWLFEIAANVRANELRSRGAVKRSAVVVSLDAVREKGAPVDEIVSAERMARGEREATPETGAIEREKAAALHAALEELPPQMRQCVRLRVVQDLKYKEIAIVMRISVETVKAHLHQAKLRLEKILGPKLFPADFDSVDT